MLKAAPALKLKFAFYAFSQPVFAIRQDFPDFS